LFCRVVEHASSLFQVFVKHHVLLAHELVAAMFEHFPSEFNRTMFGEEIQDHGNNTALVRYWNKHREDDPRLAGHPAVHDDDWRQRLVPLAVHGDGAPYKKTLPSPSLGICSWSSLLGVGENSIDTNFLYDVQPTKMACRASRHNGLDTLSCRMDIMAWDFQCLLDGVWPSRDFKGNPWPNGSIQQQRAGSSLAGGYKFCVMQLRADLLHQCNEWQFTHYHGEDRRRVLTTQALRAPHSPRPCPHPPLPVRLVRLDCPAGFWQFVRQTPLLRVAGRPTGGRQEVCEFCPCARSVRCLRLRIAAPRLAFRGEHGRGWEGPRFEDSDFKYAVQSGLELCGHRSFAARMLDCSAFPSWLATSSRRFCGPRPQPIPGLGPDSLSEPANQIDMRSAPPPRVRTPTSSAAGPD
jgi:hypothetical protein